MLFGLITYVQDILLIVFTFLSLVWCLKIIKSKYVAVLGLLSTCALFIGPLRKILFKHYLTVKHLDLIIRSSKWFGKTWGACTFAFPDSRLFIHQIILDIYYGGGNADLIGLTTTWIGPIFLDFGIVGVVGIMLWLGILMGFFFSFLGSTQNSGNLHLLAVVLYSLSWSLSVVCIDLGPDWIIFACLVIFTYFFTIL